MNTYVVLENKSDSIFLEESTSIKAIFFGPIWLLYHKLWPHFLILSVAILTLIYFNDVVSTIGMILIYIFIQLFVGFSGTDWLQQSYIKRGYVLKDVIIAHDLDSAMLKYDRYEREYAV